MVNVDATVENGAAVDQARSADGTAVGWQRSGAGPTAILLHGTSAERSSWALAGGYLRDDLTLVAVDRRGRGRSGPGKPYAFAREVEDVAAVVAALGTTPHLIGHSYGGAIALAAVSAGVPARSLVLYEPVTATVAQDLDHEALAATCAAAIAAGDPDTCLTTFYDAVGELASLERMRAVPPVYETFRRDAPTIPRELRAVGALPPHLGEGVDTPVLLLHGSASHPVFLRACEDLSRRLPTAEVAVLDGHGHLGPAFGPEAFARAVREFVRRH
jgi:pimeloyl-ACP methyl ester carboxylesterase